MTLGPHNIRQNIGHTSWPPGPGPAQKVPLLLPTEPQQKGRYWNYETERWSFCNSDDDEDRAEEVKQMNNEANKQAEGEEEEWEYYYDDVDLKQPKAGGIYS